MNRLRPPSPEPDGSFENHPPSSPSSKWFRANRFALPYTPVASLLLFLLVVIVGIAVDLAYIDRTYVNVVYADALGEVPFAIQALQGHLVPALTHQLYGSEHLLLGYRIWSIVNAKFFGLNMLLDPGMYVISYFANALILFVAIKRTMRNQSLWKLIAVFVPCAVLVFSLVAPPGLNMPTQFAWGVTISLAIASTSDRALVDASLSERGRVGRVAISIGLLVLYFLFASGGYFPGLLLGLLIMFLFRAAITGAWRDRRPMYIYGAALLCTLLYAVGYLASGQSGVGGNSSSGTIQLFDHPLNTVKALLATFAASVLDSHTLASYSADVVLLIGVLMSAVSCIAIFLFVRSKMYERTYLPIYCMFYPFGVTLAQLAGRETAGWRGITSEWYDIHMRLIPIAGAWILLYTLVLPVKTIVTAGPRRRPLAWTIVTASTLGLLAIAWLQLLGNLHEWHRAPYVKQYFQAKQVALVYPQLVTNPASLLLAPPLLVSEDRTDLERFHLASFSPSTFNGIRDQAVNHPLYAGDWWSDGWTGPEGAILLIETHATTATIALSEPTYFPTDRVELFANGLEIYRGRLAPGESISRSVPLRTGANELKIVSTSRTVPAKAGIGSDLRTLSAHITISTRNR